MKELKIDSDVSFSDASDDDILIARV